MKWIATTEIWVRFLPRDVFEASVEERRRAAIPVKKVAKVRELRNGPAEGREHREARVLDLRLAVPRERVLRSEVNNSL